MEFLKAAKRRSLLSESIYILLNIALAVGILVMTLVIDSPLPGFGLVLLSKWRVLAVRPRYWFANIQANLVDIIVGASAVILLYEAVAAPLYTQLIITALYVAWLLILKPRSKRSAVAMQAAVALFFGTIALFTISYNWWASVIVIIMWIIGYATARHVISGFDELHSIFLSLIWGLFLGELGWLIYHRTVAYEIPSAGLIQLPQGSIIILAIAFMVERVYASYIKNKEVKVNDVLLPIILSVSIILVLLLRFNSIPTSGA